MNCGRFSKRARTSGGGAKQIALKASNEASKVLISSTWPPPIASKRRGSRVCALEKNEAKSIVDLWHNIDECPL